MSQISRHRIREIIRETRGNVAEIATFFDVSRTTVYGWIKRFDLKNDLLNARVDEYQVLQAIRANGGVLTSVARQFGVARSTVYGWIKEYDLVDELDPARDEMHDIAEGNIFQAVKGGDLDLSKFVLTHMPTGGKKRWSSRQEVTGADGGALTLSSEILELLREMGIDESDVVREFEAMLREYAREKNPTPDPSPKR